MTQTWGSYASLINVNELTEYVRHAALEMLAFSQLCNAPTGKSLGKNTGDTVQYTYFPDVTTEGGELNETDDVPTTGLTPIKGTYQIKEFGNALELTEKLTDLSRLDVENDHVQALVKDMRRLENGQAFAQFQATDWVASFATTNAFATNGVPTTNTAQLGFAELRFMVANAEKRHIPYFDGESYVLATGVDSADNLCNDTKVFEALRYDSGRAVLNGEVGRLGKVRVIRDSHKVAKVSGGTGQGAFLDAGVLVGADAVTHDVACPWEMRAEDRDLHRKVKLGYLGKMVWKKILSQDEHGREHVIRIG